MDRADVPMLGALLEENELLRDEVKVARRASEITAQLVVDQFVKIEKMLQRITDSENRFRALYQESNQREQMYLSLLHSTPDAVIIFDLSEIPTYVNPAFNRIFGFHLRDIADDGFPFFVTAERKRMRRVFRQVVDGTPVSGWESRIRARSGEVLDVTVSASCYQNSENRPAGVMTILQDITPRKQVERIVRRERETFFKILDKAPYGVGLLDPDGHLVHSNAEMKRITGFDRHDIGNLDRWFELAYPDLETRRRAIRAWRRGGTGDGRSRIFPIVCKDGTRKWVEFRRTAVPDEGTVVTLSDVTERERIQQQIRRAKEEWERTFDAIEDFLTIQDREMRLVRVNLAVARAVGVEPGELIGKKCYQLFPGNEDPCPNCPGGKTMEDHLPHSAEVEPKGSGKVFSVTTWPIFDDSGGFAGMVHAAKDITGQRQMEDELLRAQKLESIGILAGGIAHDFNNILTAVLGNISLARMTSGGPKERLNERLDKAEKASLAARDLTRQLLTFAKGGAPILKTESIEACIRDSVSFVTRGAKVKVVYDIAKDLRAVEADKAQITQVINNLVINAIQAMPRGGTLTVTAVNQDLTEDGILSRTAGAHGVKISIADEGVGIEPEFLSKIFDPYFTTKPGGSGLGLATAFSIIKRHQGHLSVESTVGRGTVFHVLLPASVEQPPANEATDEAPSPAKGRILVMDDEQLIRDIAGEMLEYIGYQVGFAVDGEEALQLYQEARAAGTSFDVVIMDLTIPGGMGGEEAIQRLLAVDPAAKVIVSSGYSNDPVMSDYRHHGFRGVVTKPYKVKELSRVLRQVMGENAE